MKPGFFRELFKVSYKVFRYCPELVVQEAKKKIDFDKHIDISLDITSLRRLELCLKDDDPNFQERMSLLQKLKTSLKDFNVDHSLSLAENVANFFLDSLSRNAIFESINHYIDDEIKISDRKIHSSRKSSQRKNKEKEKEKENDEKMNALFNKIRTFIHRNIPQAVPSSQQRRFQDLSYFWAPCTFKSIEDSIGYQQTKHSPGDDQVSYMEEAKECMDRELEIHPPTPYEEYHNRLTRRGSNLQDSEFIRLVRNPYSGDRNWKVATYHSPRFTNQAHEPDGIAKLKAGESYKRYSPTPEPIDPANYALAQHLMKTKIL